jgi:hypothetical protein
MIVFLSARERLNPEKDIGRANRMAPAIDELNRDLLWKNF